MVCLIDCRNGTCSILVCSDIAARGIDIPTVSLIIQVSSNRNLFFNHKNI